LGQGAIADEQDKDADDTEAAHDHWEQAAEQIAAATAPAEPEAAALASAVFEVGTWVFAA